MHNGQVIEKILADARDEAARIKKRADEKYAGQKSGLDRELDAYRKQSRALAEKAQADKLSHALAAARMDIAKRHLAEKSGILDEIFAEAGRRLAGMPDGEYRSLMKKLIGQAAGGGTVIVDTNEKRIDQGLLDEVNRESHGGKGGLKLGGRRRHLGAGFILQRGKITINYSSAMLLDQARNELEIELAKELFS
jgi:V/A-type H+-transporting ATPase subunit E